MSDRWIANVALVTPVELLNTATQILAQVTGNPRDLLPDTYSIMLVGVGGQITHRACLVRVRESTLLELPQLALMVPGSSWCVVTHDDLGKVTEPYIFFGSLGLNIQETQDGSQDT